LPCPFCGIIPENCSNSKESWYVHPSNKCPLFSQSFTLEEWNMRFISNPREYTDDELMALAQ